MKELNMKQCENMRHNSLLWHIFYMKLHFPECRVYSDDDGESFAMYLPRFRQASVCSADNEFINEFLSSLKDGKYYFSATSTEVFDCCKANFEVFYDNPCVFYAYNGKPLPSPSVECQPLKPQFWKEVSDGTFYNPSKEEVQEAIINRPSSAVYIDGKPVCWCITHEDYSLGMLYTLPQYRRKGYALAVMLDLTAKVLLQKVVPYCYIVSDNVASKNLATKYNLEKIGECRYFGIRKIKIE